MVRIVYSKAYDMGFPLLSRMHPFDVRRASRVYRSLSGTLGSRLRRIAVAPPRQVSRDELLQVHSVEYLDSLRSPSCVAAAIEIGMLRWMPRFLIDYALLGPMRYATMGSVCAARLALESGVAFNLGGGFHHAKPTLGEGFCVYADAGVAVAAMRKERRLSETDGVAYVDLDAHLGNGVAHVFMNDERVSLFDMFNKRIYPNTDTAALSRVDAPIPLECHTADDLYLGLLREELPRFLDRLAAKRRIGLAIYNAGTDIFEKDPLGNLSITSEGVLQRDRTVLAELRKRSIPALVVPSGGYTFESASLISRSIVAAIGDPNERLS